MAETILLTLSALALVGIVGRWFFAENRAARAYADHMHQIASRCPACQPFGGWYLGAMRPDGGYEIIECDTCNGTGQLAPVSELPKEG